MKGKQLYLFVWVFLVAAISVAHAQNQKVSKGQVLLARGEQSDLGMEDPDSGLPQDNPMGVTWAVFIQNSNYKSFASLDGPSKDIDLMRNVLSNYRIDNIILKQDMTKEELERFFGVELWDMVRKNRVNSLLIWYAGHGKRINETGYWIPVDARRDDEYTYFNITNLKSALKAYSTWVRHTLVVTDAVESGPTFYQAMRSLPRERSCDDPSATQYRSSQVFSSSGYELAVENSQFTKTFANTLANNPNACIPIESIVKENQQKYYNALEDSGSEGESTAFIEFMLQSIRKSLKEFIKEERKSNQESNLKSDQKILSLMKKNNEITIREICDKIGMSESGVKKVIKKLKDENKLLRIGSLKAGYWQVRSK